ncbi:STE3-domain-containing protein [Peniophora sp. CONT]|nr:STE3-domain-containing protein [Peniophora sp. CONT]
MAAAVDPTYPLYPIASILAAAMLLLVLLTNFIRQSWNLGVAFLCFWLFLENITSGINAIIWSDSADIKWYVYCDIVTRLQAIASVVKPMATLIITRRLYLITSQRSVEISNRTEVRWNAAVEWTLGLVIPVIVAGPFFQTLRFEVIEGTGCQTSADGSILDLLLNWSWNVIPPLFSVTIYYPRVAQLFYRQSRHINRFLQGNDSVSRANYFRIIALASIDIILTLPIGIVSVILAVTTSLSDGSLKLYSGWAYVHTDWEPEGRSYGDFVALGASTVAQEYFTRWVSPVLTFVIFSLFGVTSEARGTYWRVICTICSWFGWKPTRHTQGARPTLDIESDGQPLDTLPDTELRSQLSYVKDNARTREQSTEEAEKLVACEVETNSNVVIAKEARQDIVKAACVFPV